MNKLPLIIKREYLAKVRNRSFVIMTFLSPILMVGLVVLIAYLTQINDSEKRILAVLNESNYFENDFSPTESVSYIQLKNLSLQQAKDSTLTMGFYGLLFIPDKEDVVSVAAESYLYTKDAPNSGMLERLERIFEERLRQQKLIDLKLSAADFAEMDQDFEIHAETFEGEQNIKGIDLVKAGIGGSFGYLIMMFIVIYGGFVMRSVIEEKTSRIIEVIISSVKPFQLMLGKIIGTALAGLTQFGIWIFSATLLLSLVWLFFDIDVTGIQTMPNIPESTVNNLGPSTNIASGIQAGFDMINEIPFGLLIISFTIYFLLGYLIYSSIYAAIGAAVDNETDTQQFIFPIILPLILAIYVGFFSVFNNPHGPIAVGFSLFPLTSPIVMLMRLPGGIGEGGVPIWQFVTSILILIGTFITIVWLAAKIYRVGILMYGKKPSYRELFKWLRY